MSKAVYLDVGDKKVLSTQVNYEDLVILYNQYIEKYGEVPLYEKCDSKHNMPQRRIINRVIADKGITYRDFLLQFGKTSHVRAEINDYDIYLEKFKEISDIQGKALLYRDLYKNSYGLPNPQYFIKHCPDKNVKNYNDFVEWCGYKSNKLKKDDLMIGQKLIDLEKKLGRHITKEDITLENVGFTNIVIDRIYGGLNNAKSELGLIKTPRNLPKEFEYYKCILDKILENIKSNTDRKCISWSDIESNINNPLLTDHKTFAKAFKREGIDIFSYIKSKGFMMNPSKYSYHYTFDDGERVVSTMEYEFSKYLRSLGFIYNKDYFRDVMYKTFSNEQSKINCDYKIIINGKPLYIEIAGMIYNFENENWRNHIFSSKQENEYRDKMINKENILIENNCYFIFLFKSEMFNNKYRDIFQNKIKEIQQEVA